MATNLPTGAFSVWAVYNGNNTWNISVFRGTPVQDIKATIREITGIQEFSCLDENGNILVLSSYLPNGTKIYIQARNIYFNNNNNNNNNSNNVHNDVRRGSRGSGGHGGSSGRNNNNYNSTHNARLVQQMYMSQLQERQRATARARAILLQQQQQVARQRQLQEMREQLILQQRREKATNTNGNKENSGYECELFEHELIDQFKFGDSTLKTDEILSHFTLGGVFASMNKGLSFAVAKLTFNDKKEINNNNLYAFSTTYSRLCCCYDKFYLVDAKKYTKSKANNNDISKFDCLRCHGMTCIECEITEQIKNMFGIQLIANENCQLIHFIDYNKRNYYVFYKNQRDALICVKNLPQGGVIFGQGLKHAITCKIQLLNAYDQHCTQYRLKVAQKTRKFVCS